MEAGDALPVFPDVPVTVITATHGFTDPCDEELPCEEMQAIWLDAQDRFATLTHARHVLADTTHYVHNDDPLTSVARTGLVVDAVTPARALVRGAREVDAWG